MRGHYPEDRLVKASPAFVKRIARELVEARQYGEHLQADRLYSDLSYIADWGAPNSADAAIHEVEALDHEGWLDR